MRERHDIGRTPVNLRSLRLEPGSHASPGDGVCIVELASLLGGERFSDHPRCVCDVIAAFLRGWNDRSSHAARQHLRPYGTRIVGSRAGKSVTRLRRDICLTWAGADLTGGPVSCALQRLAMRFRVFALCGTGPALKLNDGAGELAARVVFARHGAEAGFRVIDALLAAGSESSSTPATTSGPRRRAYGAGQPSLNGHFDGHDRALARALTERTTLDSGNGAAPGSSSGADPGNGASRGSSNGASPARERRRDPVHSA